MLLLMIERGMPIDMVLTADTGMEFPEMYRHWDRVEQYLYRERGLHLTILRHPKGFEWLMFDEPKEKPSSIELRAQLGVPPYGNGWPGIKVRWCTGQMKTHLISKEVNMLKGQYSALHYVGIAADEPTRIKNEQYPLVTWGITEKDALNICYDRGYNWDGLYEIYGRCSCWCCPFQKIGELRNLRRFHPELWAKLMELDERAITIVVPYDGHQASLNTVRPGHGTIRTVQYEPDNEAELTRIIMVEHRHQTGKIKKAPKPGRSHPGR